MTPTLRWLVWLAALIGLWSATLDWEQEIARLRPEKQRLEQIRQREGSALQSVNWTEQELIARQAQLSWLDRLPEVTQVGIFRAEAMETMSDLCQRLAANCQITSMGETLVRSAGPAATAGAGQIGTLAGRADASAGEMKGLLSTTVRISVGLSGNKLMPLMREIEEGKVLRKIERFTVRSGRAELVVKIFGMEGEAARVERAAALRRIEQITQKLPAPSARAGVAP